MEATASAGYQLSKGSRKAAWIFGGALILILVGVLWGFPEPSNVQRGIIRLFMALTAGFLSYFFAGGISLKGKISGQTIGAGGGFAVFVLLMFVVDPFGARTVLADNAPSLVRSDPKVEEAQQFLSERGFYTGTIDGKATTETREAIKKFQRSKQLPVTGYVSPKMVDGQ